MGEALSQLLAVSLLFFNGCVATSYICTKHQDSIMTDGHRTSDFQYTRPKCYQTKAIFMPEIMSNQESMKL